MSTAFLRLAAILFGVFILPTEAAASASDFASVEAARQATVTIRVPGNDGEEEAIGAGFIDQATRKIVTNAHIVGDREKVRIGFVDGHIVSARVTAIDRVTDIALLDADIGTVPGLIFSTVPVQVGQTIHAVGTPFGLGQTVTRGIVSALDRAIDATTPFGMIQHDAALNPGSSGGPVIDASGQVIGINVAIPDGFRRDVGVGYAIPAAIAEAVVTRLAAGIPAVERRLGISLRALTPRLAEALAVKPGTGALVESVSQNSPAERAGLVPSDIILAVGGRGIHELRDVAIGVDKADPAAPLAFDILRGEDKLTIVLPPVPVLAALEAKLKPKLRSGGPRPVAAGELGFAMGDDHGARVLSVEQGTPAAAAGIEAGDVVLAVGRVKAATTADARRLIGDAVARPFALLVADDRGATRYVVVDPYAKGLDGDRLGGNMRNPRSASF